MLGGLTQVNKDKQKNDQKTNKKLGLEDDAITTLEKILSGLEIKQSQLIEVIEKDEKSYGIVAQSKIERKLKLGASGQLVQKHEMDMKSSINKKETKISSLKEKIKALEAQKQAIDARIEKLENDITGEERAIDMTQEYFRPLIERCYEERPLDITYPPSYYKKKQELDSCQLEISSVKSNILAMKAASFDNKPQLDKFAILERENQKIREQHIRECQEAEKERIAKEEQRNKEILEQRIAERETRDKRNEERWKQQRIDQELLRKTFEEEGLLE